MDVLNLLTESSIFDVNDNKCRAASLCITAAGGCGPQIDTLIRLGADVHLDEDIGVAAIYFAALAGNYLTYSALALYYDEDAFKNDTEFASELLLNTIYGRLRHLDETASLDLEGYRSSPEHDKIMIDMFQRGVGPRTKLHMANSVFDWRAPGIHDEEFEANKLAAALGPATEAWYLGILHHCGLLAHGELQRLRELAEAGHVAAGFVYEIAEESDEVNHSNFGEEGTYSEIDSVSRRSSVSETDEPNEFWDAEEAL
jgi:hypothetical protein